MRRAPIAGALAAASLAACALSSTAARAQALDAPPSFATSPTTASGTRNADDERHDSGLGLEWVWLDADVGGSYIGLESFNSNNLSLQNTTFGGGAASVALGARILSFTAGVRARYLFLGELNLWELDGDIGFHTRIDRLDPYIVLRGGYAFDGSLGNGAAAAVSGQTPNGINLHGWNVGLAFGGDYYFVHYVSLGVDLNPEVLFLQRDKLALPPGYASLPAQAQQQILASPLYKESGNSIGFGFTGTVHLGLHL
jgi:hypothetical protein